jgi:hypothetical protein
VVVVPKEVFTATVPGYLHLDIVVDIDGDAFEPRVECPPYTDVDERGKNEKYEVYRWFVRQATFHETCCQVQSNSVKVFCFNRNECGLLTDP